MGNLGGLSAQEAQSEANIYAQKQNIENQYRSEAAQLSTQVGGQDAAADFRTADYNARSRGAQQGLVGTGLSQLSGAAQAMQRRSGQQRADQQRIAAMQEFFPNYNFNQATGRFEFKQV